MYHDDIIRYAITVLWYARCSINCAFVCHSLCGKLVSVHYNPLYIPVQISGLLRFPSGIFVRQLYCCLLGIGELQMTTLFKVFTL